MKIFRNTVLTLLIGLMVVSCSQEKEPIDYVNPYMGNISHLLIPAYPTVHLPNSMLRVHMQRHDNTVDFVKSLPVMMFKHRRNFVFGLMPVQGRLDDAVCEGTLFSFDQEHTRPNRFDVVLDEHQIHADCAVSHQSAIYRLDFTQEGGKYLTLASDKGYLTVEGNKVSGYDVASNDTRIYIYGELDVEPVGTHLSAKGHLLDGREETEDGMKVIFTLPETCRTVHFRYGVSYIDEKQAERNLYREQKGFDLQAVADYGTGVWNESLSRLSVEGADEDQKSVFYTSFYRFYERPVCLSEDGRYYSADDRKIHEDNGRPFYTDDWIWDTHLASHPLRTIIQTEMEQDVLQSYVLMAGQRPAGQKWMPTFPAPNGDNHAMNCNHAVVSVLDAWNKGLHDFDFDKAYDACRGAIEDKTLIPWSDAPARDDYDGFYKEHGYLPALHPGEKETMPEVSRWEHRQAVAVTLGSSYDYWCLSNLAGIKGDIEKEHLYLKRSYGYRRLFHPVSKLFHPKDRNGNFIPGLDYRFAGGVGGRDYYDENNAYTYRWDLKYNIGDLVNMMGGPVEFSSRLDSLFRMPLGDDEYKVRFYQRFGGDHSGNVGQFSMGNEPGFHIPYLYDFVGQPWKTQKRIRSLIAQWFRNDLMGIPGDEDGGAMSAFVVFSMMGFYPMAPGIPYYAIGSPHFPHVVIALENGRKFEIIAHGCTADNKYIQSAMLDGKPLGVPFIAHDQIADGGILEFRMGNVPNRQWGSDMKVLNTLPLFQDKIK